MITRAPAGRQETTLIVPFASTDVIRALLAIVLVGSFPFVLFIADPASTLLRTYTDAVSAVVAFYFAARSAEGGQLEVAASAARET